MKMLMIRPFRDKDFRTWEEEAILRYVTDVETMEVRRNPFSLVGLDGYVNLLIDSYKSFLLNFHKPEKIVTWCWDVCPIFMSYHSTMGKIFMKINYTGMKKSDAIVTGSENTKKDIIKYLKYDEKRIYVVPAGVDRKIFRTLKKRISVRKGIRERFGIGNEEKLFLYVGSEQPRKNLPVLLKALAELKKNGIKFRLIKIGPFSGNEHSRLIVLEEKLGLKKMITDIGSIPRERLSEFYNSADLFLFPSYYEGFGLPPLEAMACGCPVVTTNCSSIPEVVGNAAIKIDDPSDHGLFAKKITEVLENEGLRKELIKKGLERSKMFSWEKYAREIYRICKDL